MDEIRKLARERMKGFCHVCPVCDGVHCVGNVPGMGGAGTGATFRANVAALAAQRLHMRLIHDAVDPDPSLELLGYELDLPVLAAPMGGVPFNIGGPMSEEEYVREVLFGCVESGTLGGTADGVPEWVHQASFKVITELGGRGIPFIKPWADNELFAKLDLAAQTGAQAVGMDIDAAGLITLSLMGRPVVPRPTAALAKVIARTPMKFIVKGIMTPDDAVRAADAGAAAVVVSNHGGRILDHGLGTAEVLPAVAGAVKGQIPILVDGGVRTGGDVLKMLALGADAVLIGRPFAWAAIGGGREGVTRFIGRVKTELRAAMLLAGCRDLTVVGPHILDPGVE